MIYTDKKLEKIAYRYIPQDFEIGSWEAVKAYLEQVCEEKPDSPDALIRLMERFSEILKAISDEQSRRYIAMTQYTDNQDYADAYNDYYANVCAPAEPYQFRIKKLFYECPARSQLDPATYSHLNRIIANEIELFREENIPLKIQESELSNKYAGIVGQMTVDWNGEELTIAQLSRFLRSPNRELRELAFRDIYGQYIAHADELDQLFDELKALRVQIALNAGFTNYRDYKHAELGRFSYKPEELYAFHDAVAKVVVPFLKEKDIERMQALKLDKLRPWDLLVDLDGIELHPFENTEEFIERTLHVLHKVNPDYALQLEMMSNTGLLDLENRKGKAPGGYNTSIYDLGSSFIFMNHVKQHNDVVTLLHESGHAMHSKAMAHIPLAQYSDTPSEVAELASMTMELITMDYWDEYYKDPTDLKKAKRDLLEGTLSFLPWAMTVDAFQHWVYLNPEHSPEERYQAFIEIVERYGTLTDWSGLEELRKHAWMKQLHIFEVPFYYIEYGMAQLGALSIYMNYRKDKSKALKEYQDFLNLGYCKSVSEIYKTAGIDFDFSEARIRELVDFVRAELEEIDKL